MMKKKITINEERCTGCGMCVKDCFVQALTLDESKHPKYTGNGDLRIRSGRGWYREWGKGPITD